MEGYLSLDIGVVNRAKDLVSSMRYTRTTYLLVNLFLHLLVIRETLLVQEETGRK